MPRLRIAALLTLVFCAVPASSVDADATTKALADPGSDLAGYQSSKERRLNIAGWTLVGAGVTFPVVATSISASRNLGEDCDVAQCTDVSIWVTSMVLGPAMIITGTALLLKRRGMREQRERAASVMIVPNITGLTMSGRF